MTINITDKSPKTYIILGMHQSGTSFLAKALQEQGVKMSPSGEGTYENNDFVHLNNQLLGRAGGSWMSPPLEEEIIKSSKGMVQELVKAINKFKAPFWGFKDPRTSLTAKAYFPFLEDDAYLVAIFRKPDKVVESLMRRDKLGKEQSQNLIRRYNESIIRAIKEFVGVE